MFETQDPEAAALRQTRKVLALSFVGLAVFLAWQALALRSYVRHETRPPSWDQSIHMEIALDYRNALHERRWSDVVNLAPKPGMPPFPPLYHLALMRAYDGPNPAARALWLNYAYLALLCLSLFAIAFEFRPDETALGAVVIFACSPAVQGLLTTQLVDLSVVALAAAGYWALIRSDGFKNWGGSIAFGLLFAAGMMHKWSYFSYMLPAYVLALKGLAYRQSRAKVLASAGVALAGFGPWYFVHLPVLLPRLVQASSDFAIPFWQAGAVFTYFLDMADGLGPPFWVLAWVGLVVPQYRRHADKWWIIPAWVLASYVFWTIVPNRQIRFLLPGLPAMALAVTAAWPKTLIWLLTLFQVFGAVNYSAGWIAPVSIPFPGRAITFLPSDPPAEEDWHVADILREAQSRRDPELPVSNLTLVANAEYFNGPNFTWTSKFLDLPNVRMRGVNSRLCELSQFVVLKTGTLGPPGVISGLPEAAAVIAKKDGWFDRSYEKVGKWQLPDRSEAWLFQQRKLGASPFKETKIISQHYATGPFTARGVKIELGRWDAALGAYPSARMSAEEVEIRGLKVTKVAVELERLALVPVFAPDSKAKAAWEWDEVRFLRIDRLRVVSAQVDASDLAPFIESRVKSLKVRSLDLDKSVKFNGKLGHLALSAEAEASLESSPRALRFDVKDARVGVTPIPTFFLSRFKTVRLSLDPTPEMPFAIDLPGLTLKDGRLTIP